MKNKIIKLLFICFFTLAIICIEKNVKANTINSINMDIYIDKSGNANVTETWKCSANSGTEVYHPYYNLGNSKITNLRVSESNKSYTALSSWNTSGSLSSKAYKCGINKISDGVELCWGISTYGSHTYVVKYNISNFVSNLTDSQMIYWTLIPYDFSNSIGSVKIKIHSNIYMNDSVDVWGYGNYGGLAYVSKGAIYMESNGKLPTSDYMTILVKFPQETFSTTNDLNHNFNYYYEMAEDGAEKYVDNGSSGVGNFIEKLFPFLELLIFFLVFVFTMIFGRKNMSTSIFKFKAEKGKLSRDVSYYRDIPCKGDIFRAYFIAYYYGIMKNKTDLLGTIILKWLKEGIIKIDKVEKGFLKKRMDTAIVLQNNDKTFSNSKEEKLYKMLYEASGDGILEKKEFERWCSGKYNRVLGWFDDILEEEGKKLIDEGKMTKKEVTTMAILKKNIYTVTDELTEEANNLQGLKKYLQEYTLIHERESIEVELFENYLIYAQLMGIAKEVAKEFKDLYPEIIEQSNFNSYDNIIFIHHCSVSGITSANNARSAAQSYSAGGGGFSSGGGGGGSFGGGGGRRRFPLKL